MSQSEQVDLCRDECMDLLNGPSTRLSFSYSGEDSSGHGDDLSNAEEKTASPRRPRVVGVWTADEHERFLKGMLRFPLGPWSAIAAVVGTRSVRQVHSHAQKYAAKVERHKRGQGSVKRRKATDGQNSSSGHRVVPKIPGKFHSQVEDWTERVEEHGMARNEMIGRGNRDASSSVEVNSPQSIPNVDCLLLDVEGEVTEHSEQLGWTNRSPGISTKSPSRKTKMHAGPTSAFHQRESPKYRETQPPSPTGSCVHDIDAKMPPLPSLEEALDFLIVAFDDTNGDLEQGPG